MYHVDHSINRRRARALGTIEFEIPSSAACMAVIDAKRTIPENTQPCTVGYLIENTFLKIHKKSEMSIMIFAPKICALIHIPASETSRSLATYVALARPRDFVALNYLLLHSRVIKKSRIKKSSTCGKSTCSPACVILHHVSGSCKGPIPFLLEVQINQFIIERFSFGCQKVIGFASTTL